MRYDANNPSAGYNEMDFQALKSSNIPASLVSPAMRFDSAEDASVFFARELDYIKTQSYDVIYPEFTALSLFPISNEVNPGAETVTYYSYDKTGLAKIINNYATDLPRADAKGKPNTAYVRSVGDSYGYSVQEMRASRMAGKSLDVRKAEAARYAIDFTLNKIAWAGDADNNLVGVLSSGNDIPLYTIPANGSKTVGSETVATTEWAYKTAANILADINGMQKYVAKTTKNVERPDTLVLPADVFIDISTRQIDNTGYTIKKFILENAPYLKEIVSASELQADATEINPYATGETPKNVAFMFTKSEKKFTIEHPLPFYQYPIQPKGLEIEIPCEARTAGAIIYYPLSALIALGV